MSCTDEDAAVIRDAIADRLRNIAPRAMARLVDSSTDENVCIRCRVVLRDENAMQVGELTVTVEHSLNAQAVEGEGVPVEHYEAKGQGAN